MDAGLAAIVATAVGGASLLGCSALFARAMTRLNVEFSAYSDPKVAPVSGVEPDGLASVPAVREQLTYESAYEEFYGDDA